MSKPGYQQARVCRDCTLPIKDINTTGLCLYHLRNSKFDPVFCKNCSKEETKHLSPSRRAKYRYCSNECQGIDSRRQYAITRPDVIIFNGKTKLINDMFIVNDEYYDWLMQWKWHISSTGYAVNRNVVNGKKVTLRMHRLIMQPPDDMVVDHINRNPLDNRVSNMRVCTQRENMTNLKSIDSAKGYYFDNRRQRWTVDSKSLGIRTLYLNSEQEAIDYVAAAKAGKHLQQLTLKEN